MESIDSSVFRGAAGTRRRGGVPGGESPFVGLMGDVKSKALHDPRMTSEQSLNPSQSLL